MKSYKNSAYPPQPGDTVKYIGKSGYYSTGLLSSHEYTVDKVIKNKESYSIVVKTNPYSTATRKASLFELINGKGNDMEKMLDEKRTVFCMVNGMMVSSHEDFDSAKKAAAALIADDNKKKVVIAKVETVAKMKPVEIDFV